MMSLSCAAWPLLIGSAAFIRDPDEIELELIEVGSIQSSGDD